MKACIPLNEMSKSDPKALAYILVKNLSRLETRPTLHDYTEPTLWCMLYSQKTRYLTDSGRHVRGDGVGGVILDRHSSKD